MFRSNFIRNASQKQIRNISTSTYKTWVNSELGISIIAQHAMISGCCTESNEGDALHYFTLPLELHIPQTGAVSPRVSVTVRSDNAVTVSTLLQLIPKWNAQLNNPLNKRSAVCSVLICCCTVEAYLYRIRYSTSSTRTRMRIDQTLPASDETQLSTLKDSATGLFRTETSRRHLAV